MKAQPYIFSRRALAAALFASSIGVATVGAQGNERPAAPSTPSQSRAAPDRAPAPGTPAARNQNQEAPEPGSPERDFIRQVANTNYREIAIARLAEKRAQNQRVRDLARQILRDHEQATQRLTQLAKAQGLDMRVEGSGSLKDPAPPSADATDVPPRVAGPGAPIPAPQTPGYGGFGSIGAPGDDMDGSISAEDYEQLADASGREFDRRFVELMEQSHERALRQFRDAAKELDDAKLRAFADQQVPVLEQHLEHTRLTRAAVAE